MLLRQDPTVGGGWFGDWEGGGGELRAGAGIQKGEEAAGPTSAPQAAGRVQEPRRTLCVPFFNGCSRSYAPPPAQAACRGRGGAGVSQELKQSEGMEKMAWLCCAVGPLFCRTGAAHKDWQGLMLTCLPVLVARDVAVPVAATACAESTAAAAQGQGRLAACVTHHFGWTAPASQRQHSTAAEAAWTAQLAARRALRSA